MPVTALLARFPHAACRQLQGNTMIERLKKNLSLRDIVAVTAAALIVGSFAVPAFNCYVERASCSTDGSGVSWPMCAAAIWSTLGPTMARLPLTGWAPLKNTATART